MNGLIDASVRQGKDKRVGLGNFDVDGYQQFGQVRRLGHQAQAIAPLTVESLRGD